MTRARYALFFIGLIGLSIGLTYFGLTQMKSEPLHIILIYLGLSVFLAIIGVSGILWLCCRHRCSSSCLCCRYNRNIIYAEVSDAESENFPTVYPNSLSSVNVNAVNASTAANLQNSDQESNLQSSLQSNESINVYEVPPSYFYTSGRSPVYSSALN